MKSLPVILLKKVHQLIHKILFNKIATLSFKCFIHKIKLNKIKKKVATGKKFQTYKKLLNPQVKSKTESKACEWTCTKQKTKSRSTLSWTLNESISKSFDLLKYSFGTGIGVITEVNVSWILHKLKHELNTVFVCKLIL